MVKTREKFLAELDQDLARWKVELIQIEDKSPGTNLAAEVRSWIADAERIIQQQRARAHMPKRLTKLGN